MFDLRGYAFSFGHAIITIDGRQFSGISGVSVNQELQESAVYGTSYKPVRRSMGQLSLGRGRLTFSDYEEGVDFFDHLSPAAFLRTWSLDYTLVKADDVRTIECAGCRLNAFNLDHTSDSRALGLVLPFSFMEMLVDGLPFLLSAKALAQLGLRVGQKVVNNLL